MPRFRLAAAAACVAAAAVGVSVVVARATTRSTPPPFGNIHRPLVTAVYLDRPEDSGPDAGTVMAHVVASGARIVRFTLYWNEVAPATAPQHWNPSNPGDPHYNWSTYDSEIKAAAAHHLQVLVTMLSAPSWAQRAPVAAPPGSNLPSPAAFAAFTTAAAKRYSGHFQGLPRVRYWQAWNEPNLTPYLSPQLVNRRPVAVYNYRRLLNVFYRAVKAVNRGDLVVAAGLAPFRDITGNVMLQNTDWGPLAFMRDLLCIGKDLKPTCSTKVSFDVWAQHPYTSGGPTHHAVLSNDVSLGDLPKVKAVLDAAVAAGHVSSAGPPAFWVTEFSWDTNPPQAYAVPAKLAARWVAQAQLVLWEDGITEFTWLMLRDDAPPSYLDAGLYYRGNTVSADRRKPLFESFRFPVVAFKRGGGAAVWGKTPAGRPGTVAVQELVHGAWRTIRTVRTDQYGVFQASFSHVSGGWIRGLLPSGESSNGFSLANVPDHFYNPFGGKVALEQQPKPKSKPKPASKAH